MRFLKIALTLCCAWNLRGTKTSRIRSDSGLNREEAIEIATVRHSNNLLFIIHGFNNMPSEI